MKKKLTVHSLPEDTEEAAGTLKYIAGLIERDFTSGYDPSWELVEESDSK